MVPAATERLARWDRAFELSSVVPLSAFVVVHVLDYGRLIAGTDEIGARRHPSAVELAVEALVIWLPMLGHAAFSFSIWRRRRSRVSTANAAALMAHRLAGIAAGVFLLDHFVRFRLPILTGRAYPADSVLRLAGELSSTRDGFPWVAALHSFGILAVSFHLAMGLRRIVERSERFRLSRAVRLGCDAAGVVTAVVGVASVLRLAAGG